MKLSPILGDDLELALRAVRRAGAALKSRFRQPHAVRLKGPDQPVTEADLVAEELLIGTLRVARPEYGWLSEETADSPERLSAEHVWIVDPLDGTQSFIEGHPEFGVSVALAQQGQPALAVVYNPAAGTLYYAIAGGGAYRNGKPIRVSSFAAGLGGGLILASRSEIQRGELAPLAHSWRLRLLGSTVCKMVQVADGQGDAYLSRRTKNEWDVCAAALIVHEAGGRVSDLAGAELRFNQPHPQMRGIVASNGFLHEDLLGIAAALPPISQSHATEDE